MANGANSINNIPHLKAFDDVFKDRFGNLDLSPILMYMIDDAPASALPHLAKQFDVLGYKGWRLAVTDQDKRNLIKSSIELHKLKGTVYAVKKSVESVGFSGPEVIEGVGVQYDGEYNYNGVITHSGGNWASFRIKLNLPDAFEISAETIADLIAFVNEYKNARSHLVDITFKLHFTDTISYDEFIDLGEGYADNIAPGANYDGSVNYDGSINHNRGVDVCSLKIINVDTGQIIEDEI